MFPVGDPWRERMHELTPIRLAAPAERPLRRADLPRLVRQRLGDRPVPERRRRLDHALLMRELDRDAVSAIVFPSDEVCPHPYPHFAALRDEAPVHKVPGRDEYLVSRHADIVEVMKQPEVFSNLVFIIEDGVSRVARLDDVQPDRAGPIFSADPPAHTRKRRIAFDYFKPGRLASYEPIIYEASTG